MSQIVISRLELLQRMVLQYCVFKLFYMGSGSCIVNRFSLSYHSLLQKETVKVLPSRINL